MNRLRLPLVGLLAALTLTVMSSAIGGTYMIDCERDDPSPCVQVAAGFPLIYMVDGYGLSPANRVDLLGALIGEDTLLVRNFWADVLIWWTALVVLGLALRRPERQAAAPKA